jgi:biopolymer transport protein ExbD
MRQRRRGGSGEQGVEMTPMIDVVFLLLVFFVATSCPRDTAGHFETKAGGGRCETETTSVAVRILVRAEDYVIDGRQVTGSQLDVLMMRLAARSQAQRVLVQCEQNSLHMMLVRALDACAGAGLTDVSVASSRGDA